MKLGFLLQITQAGNPSDGFSVNKEDVWARQASDVRTSIKELNNFYGTEKVVYLVKFLGSLGYLICVIKASPEGSPRPDDNTAAWIFFPANISLSSDETVKILNAVEGAISQEKRTDYDLLERLFSQEYESNDVLISAVGTISSRNDANYAVRYYNEDYTLNELLGTSIAQQEYGMFKGLILIDKNKGITHSSSSELNFEPKRICTFKPIPPIDGFTPCFFTQNQYRPFQKSIEVPVGTTIPIYWVKKGYAVIKKSFIAQSGIDSLDGVKINPMEYKIVIPRKLFFVTDPNGVPVNQFDIRINHQLMEGDSMEIFESYYHQGLVVSITARGFAEWRKSGIHPQLDRQLSVTLSKQSYHYEFSIPVYNDGKNTNNDAIVTVETYHKLQSSPIRGYTLDGVRIQEGEGRINRLFLDDNLFSKLKYIAYGFASCVLVLLLYAGCSALENYEFQFGWPPIKEIKHAPQSTLPQESDATVPQDTEKTDLQRAIEYLESSETWHKDELDNFDATKGLFEALNDFNLDVLKQKKDAGFSDSGKFSEIVSLLDEYIISGRNPHVGKENFNGKYNGPNDKGIKVENYIKWLKEDHSPYVAPADANAKPKEQRSNITGKKKTDPAPANPQGNGQSENTGNKRGRL